MVYRIENTDEPEEIRSDLPESESVPEPDEIQSDELPSSEESTEESGVIVTRSKRKRCRFRSFIFSLLIFVYLLTSLAFGYWYWARPVRAEQITSGYEWWSEIAEIYGVPHPKDVRWEEN